MGPALRRGSEGGHVVHRAGIVDGCGRVRVRGIDNTLILKASRPRPRVRSPPSPVPLVQNIVLQAMDASREYELHVRQQPKQARMCGVGGIFPPTLSLTTQFTFTYHSRSSPNRPTSHRPAARYRQGKKKSPIAFPVSATAATSPAAIAPSFTYPRVFWSNGHFHAHSSRLWRGSFPPESVLLYVCQPCQARRRHGASLDEGAFPCFSPRPCGLLHILNYSSFLSSRLSRTARRVARPDL